MMQLGYNIENKLSEKHKEYTRAATLGPKAN